MAKEIKSLINKLRKKELEKKYKTLMNMANRNIRNIEKEYRYIMVN